MWKVSRKSLSLLSLFLIWILTSGFEDLDVETSAGIGAVMENVTSDDIEAVQLEEEWEDKVLARVDEYVTVRSEPNADSKALGRMFKGDGGNIVEQVDGWTKIHSGNVEGYVDNEYLVFGTEAYELAQEEVTLVATSLTGGLRIRSEASTEAKILKNVEQGAKLDVVEDTETEGTEWIQVQYAEEKTGYVSAEFVNVQLELGEAMTMEEIEKKEAEEKREKLKQQLASFQANGNEVTLLAALIQAEGGNQPYDGQVAIGAVVMNRVKSGGYPNSIAEVIYAPGQFGVVSNGSIARYLGGPKASCVQAAQEAINGYTTVGSYKHFRRAGADVGPNSIVIGNHVFY
jgi:spore germination cell wall hydrolase CwlJ-like protein